MDGAESKAIEAEIRRAFEAYERALTSNNVAALVDFFWDDPRSTRIGPKGGLYGYDEIVSFRKARSADDLARVLLRSDVNVLSDSLVVVTAEYQRSHSGRKGAQSQVWQKRGNAWRIISAHVSLGPVP